MASTDISPPTVRRRDYDTQVGMTPRTSAPPAAAQVKQEIEHVIEHEEEKPTESHALAVEAATGEDVDDRGYAQRPHEMSPKDAVGGPNEGETEVKDLGWHKHEDAIPNPLVGRLPNEELWTLIRRFNKQMYHVKSIPEPPVGGLDLLIADDEEFSPDKLRANIERLYMTVIVGCIAAFKHIARLRSWRERNRTLAFLSVYSVAWILDLIVPTLITFAMVLIVFPKSRTFCFPPAPLALIDAGSGGVKKPPAGVLGSDNSLTGAPEKHQGEAVEQEASNFVKAFSAIAISSAVGKDKNAAEGKKPDSKLETLAPDPTATTLNAADAQDKAAGAEPSAQHDKTKEPMSQAMWEKTRPVMHALADIADGWERFGNALSPTPPFPKDKARMKLAAVLAPLLVVSLFTNSYMFMKANTLIIGFAFFADPLIWRGLDILNRKVPNWQEYLQIRNTLLKGVPTDAQLTITLLRIGEANKAPLPPPQSGGEAPPDVAHKDADSSEGVSEDEMNAAIHPDPNAQGEKPADKKHRGHRLLALLKGTTRGGVSTMLGTDKLKAAAGAKHAKQRLGVVQTGPKPEAGPVAFPARYDGKKGHAYITATATTPALSWTTEAKDVDPVWSVAIADIKELKKLGGLGYGGKMVVSWATGREIADSLLIIDKNGREYTLTAIPLRDELFNRLIAIGAQMWEAW